MLKINKLKIEIKTESGTFGGTYSFLNGLNIVKGDNTVGKSTLFQSILYCLGMEELLGGKNERSMQSALRDYVEFPTGSRHAVLESKVFLEIENKSIVTVERIIKGERNTKLLRIYDGERISEPQKLRDYKDFWIHDSGGAKNEKWGFHSFLEKFLDWNLPDVFSFDGELKKLYIQTVFPAFVIEQKSGWSDFLSTIPYFGIKHADSRAIEYLLNLDVFETTKRKQQIKHKKDNVYNQWQSNLEALQKFKNNYSILVKGIPLRPEILNSNDPINIFIYTKENLKPFAQFIHDLRQELIDLESLPIQPIGQNISNKNESINEKQSELDQLVIEWEFLNQNLQLKREKEQQYREQLKNVQKELRQNKDVKKIYTLGGEAQLPIAKQICPTCNQTIEDSLFMQEVHLTPMGIDENIKYVEAQERMISAYLENDSKSISADEQRLKDLFNTITQLRKEIRQFKTELVSDERVPSVVEIEKRITLRNSIETYARLLDEVTDVVSRFYVISEAWEEVLKQEKLLPLGILSKEDEAKINDLENSFRHLLKMFGYSSRSERHISISRETEKKFLLPVAQSDGIPYNIRFDSSGSDLIRALWAYSCALYKVSRYHQTNHPKILMFDEPLQQDVADDSGNRFFKDLENYKDGQVLVFAAFHNNEEEYKMMIDGVKDFHLIDIKDKTIRPAESN